MNQLLNMVLKCNWVEEEIRETLGRRTQKKTLETMRNHNYGGWLCN
jgi:hypothetical protein